MTANNNNSYLSYLNKLVNQYNNTYHSISKKPINADYPDFTEKTETNLRAPKFKVNDIVRITKYLLLIFCSKLIFVLIKLKI